MPMVIAAGLLAALVLGSAVYCGLVVVAARRYLAVRRPSLDLARAPGVSVLKPLSGADLGLEENLRSYFEQDYPCFEILLAVRQPDDPARAVADDLVRAYPGVRARLLITGEPPYANAKVFALERLVAAATYDLVVMTDSDTRAERDLLRRLAAEFEGDSQLGLATCPYRGVGGPSFWSTLEALGMNTEFWPGVLVARLVEGMRFGVGPGMAARREALEKAGGFAVFQDYLAEDFVLGQRVAEAGFHTILSGAVIEHRIGSEPFFKNLAHRLRWVRSTRRSRPAGYIGQGFTYPLALALLLVAVAPGWWPLATAAVAARALAIRAVAGAVLHDPLTRTKWWLLPLSDLAAFLLWAAGFFGNTVVWRGRRYRLERDGTLRAVAAARGAAAKGQG